MAGDAGAGPEQARRPHGQLRDLWRGLRCGVRPRGQGRSKGRQAGRGPVLGRPHGHGDRSVRPQVDARNAYRRRVARGDAGAHGAVGGNTDRLTPLTLRRGTHSPRKIAVPRDPSGLIQARYMPLVLNGIAMLPSTSSAIAPPSPPRAGTTLLTTSSAAAASA